VADEITLRPVNADELGLWEEEFSGPEGWGAHREGVPRSAVRRGGRRNGPMIRSLLRAERTGGAA
jgi:hypothetical protein